MKTLSVITGLHVVAFFWYLEASIIRQPFWDMYSWVAEYLDYRRHGAWWAYLWQPHDVHRPVWIRLLTAFDIDMFGGVSYPFIVFTTACLLVTAWLLWRECRREVPGDFGRALGCLVLILTLTSVAAVNCAVPLINGYVHVLMASVLAIVLFERVTWAPRQAGWWWGFAALLAAASAPFASAVGWSLWPILLWLAWRGQAGRVWMMVVAVTAALLAWVYLDGLRFGTGTTAAAPLDPVAEFLTRADYLLAFLGLPWTRASALAYPGRAIGAVLLGFGAWAIIGRGLLRRPAGRLERVAIALVMFSLASAVMAMIGRAGVTARGDVLVPVRYSVLLIPLHVGLLWLAAPILSDWWSSARYGLRTRIAMGTISALLLAQQIEAGQVSAATAARMRTTIDRFLAGESAAEMTEVVYIDLDQARRDVDIMRRAGVYVHAR